MNNPAPRGNPPDFDDQAAAWVLRSDRGLTASEQDEFSAWLAADARHGPALARHRHNWRRLDRLADWRPEHGVRPNPDLLAPPSQRPRPRIWVLAGGLAAIAAAVAIFLAVRPEPAPAPAASAPVAVASAGAAVTRQVLADGSEVELNRGAEIVVEFTVTERRVRLAAGEAHFTVVPDPARPFVVAARGLEVRAVGTAFNVRLDDAAVEVLVTAGRVQVIEPPPPAGRAESLPVVPLPVLEARQRVVLSPTIATPAPQIATLTAGEIERVLAWQHRLLDFTDRPLAEVVAEFNRRNAVQLVLADPHVGRMPVSASFRSDNVEGFVALLEAGFGLRVERQDGEIRLRR